MGTRIAHPGRRQWCSATQSAVRLPQLPIVPVRVLPEIRSRADRATTQMLMDVDDVALGHTTKLRWNESGRWLRSEGIVRPATHNRTADGDPTRCAAA